MSKSVRPSARSGIGTFTSERFRSTSGIASRIPYHSAVRKIHAARVALNLKAAGLLTPFNEAQAYELQDLEPEAQIKTWKKVLKRADGKRISTALIKKVLEKKTQPRAVKVQDESRTVTDPQTASFSAPGGEKPQGPVETASEAVSQPVAASEPVSSPGSSEEKHESSVVIALQAVGKATAALQIAFGAVEHAEVFEGEAEHLDAMLMEILGLGCGHP